MEDFAQAMLTHAPQLRNYARHLTRAPDQADDLLQETLAHAISRQHLFRPGTNLRAWLCTIMKNKFITMSRTRMRHGELEYEYERSLPKAGKARQEDQLFIKETLAVAERELSQTELETIKAFLDNSTYAEAIVQLGLHEGTVKSRLSRARARLRKATGMEEKETSR